MPNKIGQRGKYAEGRVRYFLQEVAGDLAGFDFERIYDARSSKGAIGKQPGDYRFFRPNAHGLVEVKEVAHDFRLPAKNLTQIPGLWKRQLAGGLIVVLVYHTGIKRWRNVPFEWLKARETQPSWDLSEFATFQDLHHTNLYQILAGDLWRAGHGG
jgi:hypothetical protein